VAPQGSDDHPGTKQRPFASLTRARDAVRQKHARSLDRDVRVLLRGGDYWLASPVEFRPVDGGNDQHSVTYAAFPGERPRISGGRRIAGWRPAHDGTWRARLPEVTAGPWSFRELFVNGRRRPRARHPNAGYLRVERAGADRRTRFTFRPGDLAPFTGIERTELVFLHDWSVSRVPLQAVDHERHELSTAFEIGCRAPHYTIDHFEPHPRYFLENNPAFLDAPGEWFLDAESSQLAYRPLPGESVETAEIIAPVATRLIDVRGDAATGRPVSNLHFRGIDFEHCAWHPPRRGYAEGQAGFYEARDDRPDHPLREILAAAIVFERAEGCSVTDSRLAHFGGSGIHFGRACRRNTLAASVVRDVAGNGVMIGETAQLADQVAAANAAENCLVEQSGELYYGCVGIWVGMARDSRIFHNEIRDLPYTGISIGWQWNPKPTPCQGHVVDFNHIHHVMQVLSDGGGIYTLGRQPGTVLRSNHIHDVATNAGRAESNGMFLDEGTSEIVIEHNVIHSIGRSPLRFHRAEENLCERTPCSRVIRCRPCGTTRRRSRRSSSRKTRSARRRTFGSIPSMWCAPRDACRPAAATQSSRANAGAGGRQRLPPLTRPARKWQRGAPRCSCAALPNLSPRNSQTAAPDWTRCIRCTVRPNLWPP
jgi:hypothetical protein